jgi:hypothetical protein
MAQQRFARKKMRLRIYVFYDESVLLIKEGLCCIISLKEGNV